MSRSSFFEIPNLDVRFPFRSFLDNGQSFVYPHWHKEVEFIRVIKGTVKIGVDDQLLTLAEGDIYFLDSGVPHYFLASPESVRAVYQFDLSLFSSILFDQNFGETITEIFASRENWSRNWQDGTTQTMHELLNRLLSNYEQFHQNNLYELLLDLHQLLRIMLKELPHKQQKSRAVMTLNSLKDKETIAKMDTIFSYLEANYHQKISLEEIAQTIGFNSQYFSRFFKKQTGITFTEFLTEYRINIAKALLSSENSSMIEISEKSGFNSVKTFHHVFKDNVGISPKKYQKSISGN
ncbi:AraC family transcriptional regulator [Vagococcus zengguangii]|uniref:Helix-turn-helix domain-containing protein n=1 Tax=Vagococcus zengguangii TaxID=2571750 RepID=A0A4D7CSM9_9ENTE|nr:AraC family transcriptional regulator [Vagococcus zengguangii]QCI85567.1 helix-turn-helix domain-containing protein [Vagococcus zengguangii]TLG79422.1 helix-turn-helix domain-containing protein [Vagococcus zengguangii]